MFHLALKMLMGDRAKYIMLVGGLTSGSGRVTIQDPNDVGTNYAELLSLRCTLASSSSTNQKS